MLFSTTNEERPLPYVFLEVLTNMKVVRHLIRPPMIFFPGYNAQGLTSYSQKSKWTQEKYDFFTNFDGLSWRNPTTEKYVVHHIQKTIIFTICNVKQYFISTFLKVSVAFSLNVWKLFEKSIKNHRKMIDLCYGF